MTDRLYFRQLLAGRDFARDDPVARQMFNFAYLIGDRKTGDALAVDPAYSVRELVETAAADGMASPAHSSRTTTPITSAATSWVTRSRACASSSPWTTWRRRSTCSGPRRPGSSA